MTSARNGQALIHVDLKVGESVAVGDALITLSQKSGQRARLAVRANPSIAVSRLAARGSPGAQECASSTEGSPRGQYPVRQRAPALP
ncbi:MAG: hypothetical protein LBH10_02250 [Burkholderiaceae bacterium]|nr:hypothetical protein [Burkholderiaceae bacterium]